MSADPRRNVARIIGTQDDVILLCRLGANALIKRNDTAPAEWLPSGRVAPTLAEWQAAQERRSLAPTN